MTSVTIQIVHNGSFGTGVSSAALSWLHSYLTDRSRSHCVRAGQSSSTYKQCSSGVSQGSVLGPLLFTTYVLYPHL